VYKCSFADLEHGDSLHLPLASDLLPILRWVFSGLSGDEIDSRSHAKTAVVDHQSSMAGGGSCGIASTNFVEARAGIVPSRWLAKQSAEFRDELLRDLILYHLLA
ncbi:hypothetical protein DFH09DRAFT_885407, partial [Mycena vulgaris]